MAPISPRIRFLIYVVYEFLAIATLVGRVDAAVPPPRAFTFTKNANVSSRATVLNTSYTSSEGTALVPVGAVFYSDGICSVKLHVIVSGTTFAILSVKGANRISNASSFRDVITPIGFAVGGEHPTKTDKWFTVPVSNDLLSFEYQPLVDNWRQDRAEVEIFATAIRCS